MGKLGKEDASVTGVDPGPHHFRDMDKRFKDWKLSKGRGRAVMVQMAERIENEPELTPEDIAAGKRHPLPKNPIERALYMFLKACESGELGYIRELLDRLDGKPAQAVAVTGEDGGAVKFEKVIRRIIDPVLQAKEQAEQPTLAIRRETLQ